MQTRRKIVAGTGSQEHASPRFCRQQRKMTVIAEKKVRELITSAKKQKSDGIHSKKIRDVDEARDLNSMYDMVDETRVAYEASLDYTRSDDKAAKCETETIFSPTYHYPKDVCGGIPDKVNFVELFKSDNQTEHHGQLTEETKADAFVGNLSSEVSAIYLAMQHSKLECVDEHSQDTMSADGCVEPDDSDEFDDFDPYSFIKELPDLSAVVPRYRPVLLPKQTRSCPSISLVLDLDETLVHSTLEPCQDADFSFPVNFNLKEHMIFVRCRPYLKDFMERVAGLFETIIFTASQSIYAEQLLNVLDPKRKLFRHRVYRESCVYVEGNYLKDLSVLGRDLAHVIIIDNSPQAFGFQLDNGIPIESWFEDRNDQALLSLLPFLESLVGVDDVRPMIAKKFNLRAKVASAACLSVDFRN